MGVLLSGSAASLGRRMPEDVEQREQRELGQGMLLPPLNGGAEPAGLSPQLGGLPGAGLCCGGLRSRVPCPCVPVSLCPVSCRRGRLCCNAE